MEFKEVTSNEVQTEKDVLVASCGINEEHPEKPKAHDAGYSVWQCIAEHDIAKKNTISYAKLEKVTT